MGPSARRAWRGFWLGMPDVALDLCSAQTQAHCFWTPKLAYPTPRKMRCVSDPNSYPTHLGWDTQNPASGEKGRIPPPRRGGVSHPPKTQVRFTENAGQKTVGRRSPPRQPGRKPASPQGRLACQTNRPHASKPGIPQAAVRVTASNGARPRSGIVRARVR